MNNFDREMIYLVGGVFAFLALASLAGWIIAKTVRSEKALPTIQNLNARIGAWWGMAILFFAAMAAGRTAAYILFGLISFWALREFVTLTPTRRGDHRALFLAFFVVTPLHYYLLSIEWYGMFIVFIPVYAFLLLPARAAAAGDCERFLERTAKIQWGLMICVFCVSYTPALLTLDIPGYRGENVKLLFWFVLVVEMSDVLQYVWGKTLGKHPIAPTVSPNKTWEGFIGGIASAILLGTALYWATPFTPRQAAGMSLVIAVMGFAGGLTMSAIKRDRGVKDFGGAIAGHGGILDRIDSLAFAAPIFFHLTRFYFMS
jgi:phosphatidate cytidylyltransferase